MLFFGANVAENIDISANGGRALFVRNIANVTMDLNDVEGIDFRALGGADNIVVGDLSGTDVTEIDLDLRGPNGGGDGAADTITVNGTQGDDVIGVAGDATGVSVVGLQARVNIFFQEAANDRLTLNGQAGDDVINASSLEAGGIQLTMNGGLGADIFIGSEGGDLINGGDGDDTALMGAGDDVFVWNPGDDNDTLEGQAGVDRLDFNGAVTAEQIDISANGGRVRFTRDIASVTMDLNDVEAITFRALGGADRIVVNDLSGTDLSLGGVVVDLANTLGGTAGDGAVDVVTVNGSAANDAININAGVDGRIQIVGSSPNVTIFHADSGDQLVVNGGAGNDTIDASSFPLNAITLTIDGGAGDDTIVGAQGPDALLRGGIGNDNYFVDSGVDGVSEGADAGIDTVFSRVDLRLAANVENLVLQGSALQGYGNGLSNVLTGNAGDNILDGDAGVDAMFGGAGNDVYFVDNGGDGVVENPNEGNDTVFSTAHLRLSANVENLVLQGGADLQGYGNSLNNLIQGNAGSNILDGDAGADVMIGGAGNDVYFVDNAGDVVIENPNEGNDVVFSTAHFQLSENVETLVLQGNADLQGYGNSQANELHGNAGSNLLDGRGGADTMFGGLGNDVYFVDNAGDLVFENVGEGSDAVFSIINYTLTANVETLVLQGGGNLSGTGNGLANSIFGNSGGNTLDGGAGADVLTGGAGNDTFVFRAGQANGDTVVDLIGNGGAAGDSLQFAGFGTAAQGATFTQIGASNQWQIHSGLDGHNEIVTFSNGAVIDPSDFLFV
jgi:Ca2+-binding RTX toxin-like protein